MHAHKCTHTHTHTHTSPFWRSAPKSRTPPTQTLIGSCVLVPRYISEQVLAICTVNQAHKTITDFSCMDHDTAELLISVWTAQASHTLHQRIPQLLCPRKMSLCISPPVARRRALSAGGQGAVYTRESLAASGCFTPHVILSPFLLSSLLLTTCSTLSPTNCCFLGSWSRTFPYS